MRLLLPLVAALAVQAPAQSARPPQPETYTSADLDGSGQLRIVTADAKTVIVAKAGLSKAGGAAFGNQTTFDTPVISDDHQVVVAFAMYANCCTSYDIPLQLVVYTAGQVHRFEGSLPIFEWHFVNGTSRIAFGQQPVHFGCEVHWELREIATERLLDEADIPEPCGQIPNPPAVIAPDWVTEPPPK